MAQFGRPSSDVSAGAWTPTPLWSNLDEAVAADADFIACDNSTNDFCEVQLTGIANDPLSATGHVIRYRYRKSASSGNSRSVQVALYQGGTLIASGSVHTPTTTTWTAGTFTLTSTQANAITDYSDLRLRFIATGSTGGSQGNRRAVQVSWAELEVPSATTTVALNEGTIRKTGAQFLVTSVTYHNVTDDIVSITFTNETVVNGQVVLRDTWEAGTEHVIDAPASTGPTTVNSIPAGFKYAAGIELRIGGAL